MLPEPLLRMRADLVFNEAGDLLDAISNGILAAEALARADRIVDRGPKSAWKDAGV